MNAPSPLLDIPTLRQVHERTVARWHAEPVAPEGEGVWELITRQHGFNFLLWHEEDIARSPDVGDARIAQVKRAIDRYNQQRNDWIEKVDDWISQELERRSIVPAADARLNTETPGSTIDRLSILALRLFHLQEQIDRDDVDQRHRDAVAHKIAVCRLQQDDLSQALAELLDDIAAGRKRHRTYRQFKMYNDPALNPYLYARRRRAG